jgi:hypothetical protein
MNTAQELVKETPDKRETVDNPDPSGQVGDIITEGASGI